jgi:hypothetical protein
MDNQSIALSDGFWQNFPPEQLQRHGEIRRLVECYIEQGATRGLELMSIGARCSLIWLKRLGF